MIILMASIVLAIQKKLFKYLLVSLPGFLSVVVIILAPVIKRHPRYSFPIMYTLPVMLAYFIFLLHDRRSGVKLEGVDARIDKTLEFHVISVAYLKQRYNRKLYGGDIYV